MGTAREPAPVKLLVGMLSADVSLFDAATEALEQEFGPTDYRGPLLPFEHTTYYREEMGQGILRTFVAMERLVDPGQLARIKLLTNDLERRYAVEGQRRINLDPGYIAGSKLVLATTKDHAHRVYLGSGIYAEVTLTYRDGEFRPWPWTYPDYASPEYAEIMHAIRGIYMSQLRARYGSGATPR